MTQPLPADQPNLKQASGRLRRSLWVWAALLAAMGLITLSAQSAVGALGALAWIVPAGLLALSRQPAWLALVAVMWVLSLVRLIPGVEQALGADPLAAWFTSSPLELLGFALVRVGMGVTAWNQFLFYRLLYGTEGAAGLDPDLPPIPEVIPNRANQLAQLALGAGLLSLLTTVFGLLAGGPRAAVQQAGFWLGMYAFGLGMGSAFSPTDRRARALLGSGLGMAGFLLSLALGSSLTR